jgi:hypothetical protein
VHFLRQEAKRLAELEQLKADLAAAAQQLGTRERQVKKLQLSVDEKDQANTEILGRLE